MDDSGAFVLEGFLRPSAVGRRPLKSAHAGAALGSEYSVQLLQREPGQRICRVDEHDNAVGSSLHVERAGGDRDVGGLIAIGFEERERLGERRFTAVRREIGDPRHESRNRGIAGGQMIREADPRMELAETLLPQGQQAAQAESEVPDGSGHRLPGLVVRQPVEAEVPMGLRLRRWGDHERRDERQRTRARTC